MKDFIRKWISDPQNRNYCLLIGGIAVILGVLGVLCWAVW